MFFLSAPEQNSICSGLQMSPAMVFLKCCSFSVHQLNKKPNAPPFLARLDLADLPSWLSHRSHERSRPGAGAMETVVDMAGFSASNATLRCQNFSQAPTVASFNKLVIIVALYWEDLPSILVFFSSAHLFSLLLLDNQSRLQSINRRISFNKLNVNKIAQISYFLFWGSGELGTPYTILLFFLLTCKTRRFGQDPVPRVFFSFSLLLRLCLVIRANLRLVCN